MKYGLTQTAVGRICAVFARFPAVEKAVLYGSRAKGNFKPGSDIDLTLYGEALTSDLCSAIASALDDLERQRASVERLMGLFAERLGQHEDTLSTLQEDSSEAVERLDRQAEAIRSISQAQAQQMALVKQILELLKRFGTSTESQTRPPGAEACG